MNEEFSDILQKRTDFSNAVIAEFLPKEDGYCSSLKEAMNYSINVGGKRLRPIFIYTFYRLFGGSSDVVKPFMAAMEMLHTYSLVHDDLPALDNDAFRRGKPTTHSKYGEALGVLAGDGLLHLAYETAIKSFEYGIDSSIVDALRIFGDKTGINGMLGGQSADVVNTGKDIDDDLMYYIYEYKTGALIEGSMMIGAVLAGADSESVDIVKQIGLDIGLAFQIKDDLLDIYGNEELIGKPINSDERNNKKTYVTVNGYQASVDAIERLSHKAMDSLDNIGCNDNERGFVRELFDFLINRDK